MSRPDVIVTQGDGNLGRVAPAADGTSLLIGSGVAVAGKFALGDLLGPFRNLSDVEAAGIDAAFDDTNSMLLWHHCRDFFTGIDFIGAKGTELYIMPVADTVTMVQMVDKTASYAASALAQLGGEIKKVIVTRIPDAVSTLANQFEEDLLDAITKAQELRDSEFAAPRHRPVKFWFEGRNWQGNASSSQDLALKDAKHVSVVISQDRTVAALKAAYNKYANVALAAGIDAALPVQRNIGRVRNGKLPITNPGFSNGSAFTAVAEASLDTLHEKRFVFIWKHAQKAGYYFNEDHNCAPLSSDYAYGTDTDVADKVSRLTRQVYLDEVLEDFETNAVTGLLEISVVKTLEGKLSTSVLANMPGEISGLSVYIDPSQDVRATGNIAVASSIVSRATGRTITVNQTFAATQTA